MDPRPMSASYDQFASRYEEIFEQRQRKKIETLSQFISFVPNGHFLDAAVAQAWSPRILGAHSSPSIDHSAC